jgi:hypothetical protein
LLKVEVLRKRANRWREDRENSIHYASGEQDIASAIPHQQFPVIFPAYSYIVSDRKTS